MNGILLFQFQKIKNIITTHTSKGSCKEASDYTFSDRRPKNYIKLKQKKKQGNLEFVSQRIRMKCKETDEKHPVKHVNLHHYSHTDHHNLLYEYPCAVQQKIQSKLTAPPHTTYCPAKISLILFVLAVMKCVIGLILREFCALAVGKNVLSNGCNFFDNGLNFNALLSNTTDTNDTNDTTDAAFNTSNFINLRTTIALNSSITFDLTAVSATVATTIQIENKNIFDRETQSLHITPPPAFVFNNIDNGLRVSGAVGYVHDVSLDGIAFDWVVDKKFECFIAGNFYFNNGMCIFAFLGNFSVAKREFLVCFALCQGVYFVS